ncbi:MAG: hypothetical protein MPL62_15110 [Alphaproteobacteria bacterium]|nr:hypothetical protein [Alphaproteobacteria bacterium]
MSVSNAVLVLAAAAVGSLGGIVASIYAQYRQSKREKYKELRSNLLAVALEVSKIYAWAQKEGNYYASCPVEVFAAPPSQGLPTLNEPYPVMKIHSIVSLYFPEILDDATALTGAGLDHQSAAFDMLHVRYNASHGKASQNDIDVQYDNVLHAFENVVKNQKRFQKLLQELMSKYINEKP